MWSYDVQRLRLYLERRAELPIQILESEGVLALRFDEVGYFNRAIVAPGDAANQRRELLAFYGGGVLPFRVSKMPSGESCDLGTDGFVRAETEEYLVSATRESERGADGDWTFERLEPDEVGAFFSMYLRLFSGADCRREEALRNMKQLVDLEGLRCCWALHGGKRAGLGMWQRQGTLACFCAGAILPEFRGRGGHSALLQHRLQEARLAGCKSAVAVAKDGSDSGRNLRRVGFRLAWRDEAMFWPGVPEGGKRC